MMKEKRYLDFSPKTKDECNLPFSLTKLNQSLQRANDSVTGLDLCLHTCMYALMYSHSLPSLSYTSTLECMFFHAQTQDIIHICILRVRCVCVGTPSVQSVWFLWWWPSHLGLWHHFLLRRQWAVPGAELTFSWCVYVCACVCMWESVYVSVCSCSKVQGQTSTMQN